MFEQNLESLKMNIKFLARFSFCFFLILISCHRNSLPTPPLTYPTLLQGQVLNLSHLGPIPIGWVPPPLEVVSTIIVLDENRKTIAHFPSDSKGKFLISLPEGIYYLRVKESPIPEETGPYILKKGQTTNAVAHFDNGMR